jgi:hypothetical protein
LQKSEGFPIRAGDARIRRMAIYTMSQAATAKQARLLKKMRWWAIGVSAVGIAISFFLIVRPGGWLVGHISHNVQIFLFSGSAVLLVQMTSPWRKGLESKIQQAISIEISADEISMTSGMFSRCFRRDEIVRMEESGRGLFLLTSNRYRSIFIPGRIDGYQEIKDDLTSNGAQFVRRNFLRNWEEYLFVLLFCGTMICDLVTRNRTILFLNLAVALLVGTFGIIFADSFWDNRAMSLRMRLGSMIPAIATLLAILFPIGLF